MYYALKVVIKVSLWRLNPDNCEVAFVTLTVCLCVVCGVFVCACKRRERLEFQFDIIFSK